MAILFVGANCFHTPIIFSTNVQKMIHNISNSNTFSDGFIVAS